MSGVSLSNPCKYHQPHPRRIVHHLSGGAGHHNPRHNSGAHGLPLGPILCPGGGAKTIWSKQQTILCDQAASLEEPKEPLKPLSEPDMGTSGTHLYPATQKTPPCSHVSLLCSLKKPRSENLQPQSGGRCTPGNPVHTRSASSILTGKIYQPVESCMSACAKKIPF
ncbi:hypothetical protein AMECASPLE_036508 [Ameca splendens]|uniref:Uncharacterized protein n=1 Tax=Ameca splendens TaxID=208324 RepID=A0ABV1AE18_9TELE